MPYGMIYFLTLFLALVNVIAKKYEVKIENAKARTLMISISAIIITLIISPSVEKDNFLLEKLYKTTQRLDYRLDVHPISSYEKYGVIGGMYQTVIENRQQPPKDYKKENVEAVLSSTEPVLEDAKMSKENSLGKPNIIVMFQESYWDTEKIQEVKFNKEVTEEVRKLKNEGTSVELISPTYGGASANIEFEILTGGNMSYFPQGYMPFMQLYKSKKSEKAPSIIKELKNNGYKSRMIFGNDYYLSEPVYKKLGIDRYTNAYKEWDDYETKIQGCHLSDEALVDEVIKTFEDKEKGQPLFYMNASIETHMPFYKNKYENYDIQVKETTLSEHDTEIIQSYAQGIYNANKQIKRLYEYIKTIEEPTIIVFLGDHLPFLYDENEEDLLSKLSYFNTEDEKTNIFRKYNTEGLILNNYNAQIKLPSKCMSPDALLVQIINEMEIETSSYYKWLDKAQEKLPGMNQYIFTDTEGNIEYLSNIEGKNKENYIERQKVQYYMVN